MAKGKNIGKGKKSAGGGAKGNNVNVLSAAEMQQGKIKI